MEFAEDETTSKNNDMMFLQSPGVNTSGQASNSTSGSVSTSQSATTKANKNSNGDGGDDDDDIPF
ncbi:MAG: hypothetical protein K0U72_05635 [Gammaproteobacteria bacterium]|nr:hypothetical protein [Gammaproteobacteria bacterium]